MHVSRGVNGRYIVGISFLNPWRPHGARTHTRRPASVAVSPLDGCIYRRPAAGVVGRPPVPRRVRAAASVAADRLSVDTVARRAFCLSRRISHQGKRRMRAHTGTDTRSEPSKFPKWTEAKTNNFFIHPGCNRYYTRRCMYDDSILRSTVCFEEDTQTAHTAHRFSMHSDLFGGVHTWSRVDDTL